MRREYSREGLAKIYQSEANLNRDRKIQEKNSRLVKERKALDLINMEIEMEKRNSQN
jgi:hypothetical protein